MREAGHGRVVVINEMRGIARMIKTLNPDVIVIDIENPQPGHDGTSVSTDTNPQPSDCNVC